VKRRDFIKVTAGAGALTMAAMKAQEHSIPGWEIRPRGASRPVSIDVHTHWTPAAYTARLGQLGRPMAGNATAMPLREDLDRRIKWMDERGVQMMVLSLSGGMPWQWVSADEGARLARIVNDAGIEAHAAHPDRLLACIEISIRDPQLCLKEIDRMAGKPGMCGVHLPNSLEGRDDYVFAPAFAPVLERCEALGLPLLFHPMDGEVNYYGGPETRLAGPLSESVKYWNTLGFMFETATTATKFIVTGTLDKFPKLEIVLPHSGGSFPYIAGRVEHGLTRKKFPLRHPFKDYIRRFHYDTLTFDLETLRFLVELAGSDRVVIGTDNAFGPQQFFEWPNAIVEALNLPAVDQDRILRGNAKRLFRL